jgi:hypothetical protein
MYTSHKNDHIGVDEWIEENQLWHAYGRDRPNVDEDLDEEYIVIFEFKSSGSNQYSIAGINHEFEQKFNRLAEQWNQETMFMSRASDITSHFAYYQIIGMGPNVIPLILRQVQRGEGHWFLALRALTGENPVKAEDTGYLPKMAQAWVDWGKQRGLIEG